MDTIAKPFGWLLLLLYNLVHNYGLAVILFALIVKLILLPFGMKSKKSMMRTTRLSPKLKELEKKHGANKAKYQEEVAKLYKEEEIKPLSGCLWTLLPFPILIALYSAIRKPLTVMMGIAGETASAISEWLTGQGLYTAVGGAYSEIGLSEAIHRNWDAVTTQFAELGNRLVDLDYSFLGLNLGDTPSIQFWNFDWSNAAVWVPQLGMFLIPIISAALTLVQSLISTRMSDTPTEGGGMKGMMFLMPLLSLWIGFAMPAALGIYWIASSLFSLIQDVLLTIYYKKKLDAEDAVRREKQAVIEAERERKRQETEKLRAQNATVVNPNTSKRKIQKSEKIRDEEKTAKWEQAKGLRQKKETDEPSRVGDRPYARGRNYKPDRYGPVQAAAAATPAEPEETAATEETDALPQAQADAAQAGVIEAGEIRDAQPALDPDTDLNLDTDADADGGQANKTEE